MEGQFGAERRDSTEDLALWIGSPHSSRNATIGSSNEPLLRHITGHGVHDHLGLLRELENGLHEFVVHLRVGAANGIGCAIFKIVPKNDPRDLPQGVLSSGKLRQYFLARPLRVDHLLDAPELSLRGLE